MPPLVEILSQVERWLLPAACLLCKEPVGTNEGDALICHLCRLRWLPISHPVCERCGQPSFRGLEGSARQAVHQLKYEGWSRAADAMAESMRGLEPLTGQVCLIPIPLGKRRQRVRGYNQSERIAGALASRIGLPVRTGLLQ